MRALIGKLSRNLAPNGLAVAAVAVFALTDVSWLGYLLCVAALAYVGARTGLDGLTRHRMSRGLVAAALLVDGAANDAGVAVAATGTLLLGLIAFEPRLAIALATRRLETAHLPVHRGRKELRISPRTAYVTISALTVGFLAATAAGGWTVTSGAVATWTAWALTAMCAAVVFGFAASAAAAWLLRRRSAHTGDAGVLQAVREHAPRFAVHFAAPPGSQYQLLMWLPYFDKLGDDYLIILRDRAFLPAVAEATDAPVVVAGGIADVESMLTSSIRAVFYVNNSMQNTQCVRFAQLTHVQLMHGDSDKPASYNPISAMYDRIFVAGQAGVDRYHNHGIDIPTSRFRIVGHPQAARVRVPESPRGPNDPVTMLYAPTWTGLSSDVNFSSLPLGERIVAAFLEQGATVVMRPHPYTRTNPAAARQLDAVERLLAEDRERTGRAHLFGKTTSQRMSLIECVNAADVMVSDMSGAASDWLYSEKPFAIVDVLDAGEQLPAELPLAGAAYVIRGDGDNLDAVCRELLDTDSLAAERHKMKTYYMGDFPAAEYEQAFLEAARDCYRV